MQNLNELLALIKSCNSLAGANQIHAHLISSRGRGTIPEHSFIFLCNHCIQMFSKCGSLHHAHQLFLSMPAQDKDCHSWVMMLSAFALNGRLQEAEQLFSGMPQRNLVSWNSLLVAYISNGDEFKAENILHEMPEWNLVSWTVLLSAYARKGQTHKAKSVFDCMLEHDLFAWNALLTAFRNYSDDVDEIKRLFDRMPEFDIVSFNTVLFAHTQQQDLQSAKLCFESMPEVDAVSYTSLLKAYAADGLIDEATRLFDQMPEKDVVACTVMLEACKDLKQAKSVYDHFTRDVIMSNAMVSAYARFQHLEEARILFDKMPTHDAASYNAILAAYVQSGYLNEAEKLLIEMPEPGPVSWSIMLHAYVENGRSEEAKRVFDALPLRDDDDASAQTAMLAAFAKNSSFQSAVELLRTMNSDGVAPIDETFACLLVGCSYSGKADVGVTCFRSMIDDYGVRASKQHFCCMVDMFSRCGRLELARDLICNMPFVPAASAAAGVDEAVQSAAREDPGDSAPYVLLASLYSGS